VTPQQTIAHYRITTKLGEGGMGEVWRATDTKLGRDVALKILPEAFARDADRKVPFAREAQVLASLNHPNIAAIYGLEERALVLELVEGPTLAERLAQGPIPLDEALPIARQIAEGLEYAHERGIVHRDLKPANVKVTREGRVKVLDFGLAKAMSSDAAPSASPMTSPTLTMRETQVGTILGTAAYMAPEQARGHSVDPRADIWAFGVVLYEILTGRTLFAGPSISDTLAAVLKTEPDLSAIPAEVRPILERCLRKDLRRRWQASGDVRLTLEEGLPAAAPPAPRRNSLLWPIAAAVLAVALAAAVAGWWRAARPAGNPLTRLSVDLGPDAVTGLDLSAAISPDGRRLIFPMRGPDGKPQLATRLLDQAQATLLPGTEDGRNPFFSPDGQSIGFFTPTQLKTISVQGGAPVTLCGITGMSLGGSWSVDGNIIANLGQLDSVSRVPASGGTPQRITRLASGSITHRWPQLLPGGEAVLFTASRIASGMDNASIEAVSLKTGQVRLVQPGGYYGRYLPSGHLVYVHQGVLFGVKFDPQRLETRGAPKPLVQDVAANPVTGGGQFDFSTEGTLVYSAGKNAAQTWDVFWLDGSGKMQPLIPIPGVYAVPRVSPDSRKLAFLGNGSDVYTYDLQRETTTRLTFTGDAQTPLWAPDGKHILYASLSSMIWRRSDGAGELQKLLDTAESPRPWSFSPDGRRVAYFESGPKTGFDIWTAALDLTDPDRPKAGTPEPFLRTPADEMLPTFSPDGRWIAYRSNQLGSNEIYVRPFPAASGGEWQISTAGALYAFWSKNGHELFYETADNRIMVVDYSVEGPSFVPGKPRVWSDRQLFNAGAANADLAPDGKRFAVFALPQTRPGDKGSVHVTMLLNFFDELKRKLP